MNASVEAVAVDRVHQALGIPTPLALPEALRRQPLVSWTMDADDYILRYLFRHLRPMRHLEFGTWRGEGVVRCVEECDATVWTVNVLQGESKPAGGWAYADMEEGEGFSPHWSERYVAGDSWVRSDAYGLIGRKYLDAGWGKRVCQVYADSREWDTRAYPDGFFDTAFIDGGHAADIVENDTRLALRLVRTGGLIVWHDFCPLEEVTRACTSTRDVVGFVEAHVSELREHCEKLFWVEPSWLLVGVPR